MATTHANTSIVDAAPFRRRPCVGDISGAFADGAILFPFLVALAWQTGAAATTMLATTGVAYLAAGWLFRLPIPVQPLKSVAITAIAVGASLAELRIAAAMLAVMFLAIALANVNRLARLVPTVLVHGIQLGLGLMLLVKALMLVGLEPLLAAVIGAMGTILAATRITGWPVLGGVAVASLLLGFWYAETPEIAAASADVRPWILVALVAPQLALSLTNAVLGTQRTAEAYFGTDAARVTPRRLLGSLGFGNLAVAAVGGLPFCHGSGGVTAHVHGGSRSEWSNVVIGSSLLALAMALYLGGHLPAYPDALQATLLGAIGICHIQLAAGSWRARDTRPVLLVMGAVALFSLDMLAVLASGILLLLLHRYGRALAGGHIGRERDPREAPERVVDRIRARR